MTHSHWRHELVTPTSCCFEIFHLFFRNVSINYNALCLAGNPLAKITLMKCNKYHLLQLTLFLEPISIWLLLFRKIENYYFIVLTSLMSIRYKLDLSERRELQLKK